MSSNRVYIGRLPYRCQERDIERFFKGTGRIREIMLKNGYCFVEFEDHRDAEDAVYERNGQVLCGERVVVEHARGTPHGEDLRKDMERGIEYPSRRGRGESKTRSKGDYRLIVENLSTRISWQDLKDFMRQAGEVTYADAHRDRRNEGIVEFATKREMERALDKLDGADLNGRRIRLVEANRRRRSRSRSHRKSGSSKSRSRSPRGARNSSLNRRRKFSKSKSPDDKERSPVDRDDSLVRNKSLSRSLSHHSSNGENGAHEGFEKDD